MSRVRKLKETDLGVLQKYGIRQAQLNELERAMNDPKKKVQIDEPSPGAFNANLTVTIDGKPFFVVRRVT